MNSYGANIRQSEAAAEPRSGSGIGFSELAKLMLVIGHIAVIASIVVMLAITTPLMSDLQCARNNEGLCSNLAIPLLWISGVILLFMFYDFIIMTIWLYNYRHRLKTDILVMNSFEISMSLAVVLLLIETVFAALTNANLFIWCCSIALALFLLGIGFVCVDRENPPAPEQQRLVV